MLGRTEKDRDTFELDTATAAVALKATLEAARKTGLIWHAGSITLQARPDLVKLVAYSDGTTGGGAEGE